MSTPTQGPPDDRFVLAFYGLNPAPAAAAGFFQAVSQWFTALGHIPDKLGVKGSGYGGKLGDFRRTSAKLDRNGFDSVEAFDIHCSKPNAVIASFDFFASATFTRGGDGGGCAAVAVPANSAQKMAWRPVANTIVRAALPAYGIGYTRALKLGPIKYALGLCQGLDDVLTGELYEQARHISRWSDVGMSNQVYRQGLLRDVYPFNFLTSSQLTAPCNGVTLEQWIRGDDKRGTLTAFEEDVWLWAIDESLIQHCHDQLWSAGAIFDWRRHA